MKRIRRTILFSVFLLLATAHLALCQSKAMVKGTIVTGKGTPLDLVNIALKGLPVGTVSDENGYFQLQIPSGKEVVLNLSRLGFETIELELFLNPEEKHTANLKMYPVSEAIEEILILESQGHRNNLVRINPKLTQNLPQLSGGAVESLIKTLPGVSSNNELSSQYNVRGGNFDENLVYVNDVEIYRPFLARSGQQEGLSFINPDMVSSINFSAGGFDASYGDKMSSVLDIKYRKPVSQETSAELSLLGASTHFEGTALDGRFTHTSGLRYKTTGYLLGSLDESGDYRPSYFDFQTYLTYQLNDKTTLAFLGNVATNSYQFVPETRQTQYGTWNQAYRLTIYFDGQEKDKYNNRLGAFTLNYNPQKNLNLKFIASGYKATEHERYDIQGQYLLNELDVSLGGNTLGDSTMNIGIGTYLDHARNELNATVYSIEHRGSLARSNHFAQWGIKIQHEKITDQVNEWQMRDSAGYSLPYNNQEVLLYKSINANNKISSERISGFIQDTWTFPLGHSEVNLTGGVRAHHWTLNKQTTVSPRIAANWQPQWKKRFLFRLAWGKYHQMPFFKELKNRQGEINTDVKAQTSTHYLIAADRFFRLWNRPFKFTAEAYHKTLTHLIPYQIDNVRIRYLSDQQSKGYTTGLDLKINGEFVSGIQSWAGLSIMQTEEDIIGDQYTQTENGITTTKNPGYIPRPTDQRVNFSLFFQDYFPGNPSVRMYMTLLYGSRLPFGPPQGERYMDTFRIPAYRRVDIGFSKLIVGNGQTTKAAFFKPFKQASVSLEIFNLLDVNNTISYFWVTDIRNQMHAVPNYLTGRRLNLKLSARF